VTASPDADREAEKTKRQPIVSADPPPTDERVGANETTARRSSNISDSTIEGSDRTIDEINRDEIMAAIRDVFKTGESLDPDTAITDIARVLGFRRTGARIHEELRSALRTAIRRHIIHRDKGVISLECATIDDYNRDELIGTLLAAMGTTWWDREDAIRAAAHRLGFRRTGSKIRKAFKSAINGAIRRGLLEYDDHIIRRSR
jgi:hypothetical protein